MLKKQKKYNHRIDRWAAVGPYYAMFPIDFIFNVIEKHSKNGDIVLDPFAGRASSIYAASLLGRRGVGIEINPVGWIYGKVKLNPAPKSYVLKRLLEIDGLKKRYNSVQRNLPEFFRRCYSPQVLSFLISARRNLKWRNNAVDRTLTAIILIYLHGKIHQSLSNQMRQGKAMSPQYSVKWWKKNKLSPPNINPVDFLTKRIDWRYAKGKPNFTKSKILFGNSVKILQDLKNRENKKFGLLVTSPPYFNVTNYYYDQWLRLWLLGDQRQQPEKMYAGKFASKPNYENLLKSVFKNSARLMKKNAVIYVRTDARDFTLKTTIDALHAAFPKKVLKTYRRPFKKQTQTALYGDKTKKPGEVDVILR